MDCFPKQSAKDKDNKDRDVGGPCSGAPGPSYSNVTSVSSRPPQTHSGSGISSSVSPVKETTERMEKGDKHSHREKEKDKEQMSSTTTTASSVKTASKVIVSSAGPSAPTTRSSPTKDASPVKERREELRTSVSTSEPPRRVRTPAKDTHPTNGAASPRTAAQMDVRVGQRVLDAQAPKLTPAPTPLVRASTPLKDRGLGISTLTGPDGTITHTLPGGQPVAPTMNVRDFVEANLKEKKREAEVERQRRQEEERKRKVESESHLQQKEREEREKAEHEKMKKLKEKEERERKKEEERKRKEEEERRKKKEKEEAEKRKRQEEEERRKKKEEEEAKKREEEERRRKRRRRRES